MKFQKINPFTCIAIQVFVPISLVEYSQETASNAITLQAASDCTNLLLTKKKIFNIEKPSIISAVFSGE